MYLVQAVDREFGLGAEIDHSLGWRTKGAADIALLCFPVLFRVQN